MTEARQRAIEILEGFPQDVVAIEAFGHVGRADYEGVLIPAVEERIRAEGKVKLLYIIGDSFAGFSAGAAWDDARLGFLHMGDFARVAVVTDVEWIRMGVKLFAPLLPSPVHVFHLKEAEAAKAWLISDDVPGGPEAEVSHRIPSLEDRQPPEP